MGIYALTNDLACCKTYSTKPVVEKSTEKMLENIFGFEYKNDDTDDGMDTILLSRHNGNFDDIEDEKSNNIFSNIKDFFDKTIDSFAKKMGFAEPKTNDNESVSFSELIKNQ